MKNILNKVKVQTQWLSWIDQSALNSYLDGNNICNVAFRHITNILKGKIWSDHRKITFTKAGRWVNKRNISTPRAITLVKMTINPNHQKLFYFCERMLGQNLGMTNGMGLPAATKVPLKNLVSYCKFWIYWVGVNTKFTIWQLVVIL